MWWPSTLRTPESLTFSTARSHTLKDTPDRLSSTTLERVGAVVLDLILLIIERVAVRWEFQG